MEAWGFVEPGTGCVLQFKPPPHGFLEEVPVGTPPSGAAQHPAGMAIPPLLPMVPSSWKSPCQTLWFLAVSSIQLLFFWRLPLQPQQPL